MWLLPSVNFVYLLQVNEEGTEAAASTAVIVGLKMTPKHPDFIADHPFMFLIRWPLLDLYVPNAKIMHDDVVLSACHCMFSHLLYFCWYFSSPWPWHRPWPSSVGPSHKYMTCKLSSFTPFQNFDNGRKYVKMRFGPNLPSLPLQIYMYKFHLINY